MKTNEGFNMKAFLVKWLHIATGCLVTAGGVMILKHASVVTGGTAGLSLSLSHFVPVPFHYLFTLLNIPFFGFSYFYMGKMFTLRTVAAILMLSALSAVDGLLPEFAIQPVIGSIVGGAFIGAGIAYLFRNGASLGGATIFALYLHKRHGFNPGKTNFIFDFLVVLTSLFALPLTGSLLSALSIAVTSGVLAYFKRKPREPVRADIRAEQQRVLIHAEIPANGVR
ncbi:YitT family protein [Paenibacillus sp. LHD-117]|uniref:YitT family protein n=1 Tax=Paenibacillus sp. LHD-117 TaxID=3071412 RepID=UPI0027E083BF|nr:YitT family protein [Paenibacillus sp. LHD-117]MDQ6419422.1 YitT family protein [Paenibacillus sp. LHD-117]